MYWPKCVFHFRVQHFFEIFSEIYVKWSLSFPDQNENRNGSGFWGRRGEIKYPVSNSTKIRPAVLEPMRWADGND
jgi:hypothetical protein